MIITKNLRQVAPVGPVVSVERGGRGGPGCRRDPKTATMPTMFTGIVVEQGEILEANPTDKGAVFTIRAPGLAPALEIGASVSVDGCCLTVIGLTPDSFSVEATPETLRLTNLGTRQKGEAVNLEPPARLSDFLGGHLVQGHVDGVAETVSVRPEGNSWVFRFSAPETALRHCVLKGSVTVNGVSLTISGLGADHFEVTIIPHTMEVTNFAVLKPGDRVNLEGDVISKYVETHVKRIMATICLLATLFSGSTLAAGLPLGSNTVLIFENSNPAGTTQFVVRLARLGPDVVMEWESTKDQGTVHLHRGAVQDGRGFTLTQLFEVGVDSESDDQMTLLLSTAVYRDLIEHRSAKIRLNNVAAKMVFKGRETYSLMVDKEPVEVEGIAVGDNRGGDWLFLDSEATPLLLRYSSRHFTQRLAKLSAPERSTLRWIHRLPPIR